MYGLLPWLPPPATMLDYSLANDLIRGKSSWSIWRWSSPAKSISSYSLLLFISIWISSLSCLIVSFSFLLSSFNSSFVFRSSYFSMDKWKFSWFRSLISFFNIYTLDCRLALSSCKDLFDSFKLFRQLWAGKFFLLTGKSHLSQGIIASWHSFWCY